MMKIIKGKPLIDQHDKNCMYGKRFGGNYVPETLKKPIDDLTNLFGKLRHDKKFLKERDYYFKNYIGVTPFFKLKNLTNILVVPKFGVNKSPRLEVVRIKFTMPPSMH